METERDKLNELIGYTRGLIRGLDLFKTFLKETQLNSYEFELRQLIKEEETKEQ